MSNITPIRSPQPQWGGGGWGGEHHHDGWMWDGNQWIWPGPPPCPPPPQPCPPPVQCGPPSSGSAIAKASACYSQSQSLYNLVSQVVSDIFTKNPGIIPAPPATAGSGPILGVTDGTLAQPGQVGEVIAGTFTGSWAGQINDTNTVQSLATIMLTPGDWNVSYALGMTIGLQGAYCVLNPVPTGFLNNMMMQLEGYSPTTSSPIGEFQYLTLSSEVCSANLVIPTVLVYSITLINSGYVQDPGSANGVINYTMRVFARRAR